MTFPLVPGTGIFFMRVGTHAGETLTDIVTRKSREIDQLGNTFWGYGGNVFNPLTTVQPFAKDRAAAGMPVYLCMEEMVSERYFGESLAAAECSSDGCNWNCVPSGIEVLGSRYALKITDLKATAFDLHLEDPVGPGFGRAGNRFVRDTVDKSCLVIDPNAGTADDQRGRRISLCATVLTPHAFLLRNYRPRP